MLVSWYQRSGLARHTISAIETRRLSPPETPRTKSLPTFVCAVCFSPKIAIKMFLTPSMYCSREMPSMRIRGVLVLAANSSVCETVTRCWRSKSVFVSHTVRTATLLTIGKVVVDSVVVSQHTCKSLSHGLHIDTAVADRPRPFAITSKLPGEHPE
jgi:hypothetical protein